MAERAVPRARLSSEERRTSIVEAAIRLFAEKGFRGTTTRELAAAVGVTEPVLYEHFRTKRELYDAIVEQTIRLGTPIMEAFREKYQSTSDDRQFFTELGSLILRWYSEDTNFIRILLFAALEQNEMSELFDRRIKEVFVSIVLDYLDRRAKEGAFRQVHPALAAKVFTGMVGSYAQSVFIFRCPAVLPDNEVVKEIVNIFLEGLCPRTA